MTLNKQKVLKTMMYNGLTVISLCFCQLLSFFCRANTMGCVDVENRTIFIGATFHFPLTRRLPLRFSISEGYLIKKKITCNWGTLKIAFLYFHQMKITKASDLQSNRIGQVLCLRVPQLFDLQKNFDLENHQFHHLLPIQYQSIGLMLTL